ncbi:MAG: hypothetical protein JWP78_623 [Mucilaginibacter sp.]|nr:hypothetical protein [Mucilaginibacter sp.]
MKKLIILVLVCSAFTGCHFRRFYSMMEGRPHAADYKLDSLMLDSSYQLYVRQIGKPKGDFALSRNNMEETSGTDQERIELQYLLLSAKQKKVIYLTTIPPLHTGDDIHRWIYDEPLYENTNYVNIWVLNLFFIGAYDESAQTFTFQKKDGQSSDTWTVLVDKNSSLLTVVNMTDPKRSQLQHVDSADPRKVLELSIKFYKQKDFHLGYDGNWLDSNFSTGTELTGNRLALYYANDNGDNDIFFHVGKQPGNNHNFEDLWVHFYDIRIRYQP